VIASRLEQALRGIAAPLRLVIFDCDGVLIDSEAIANRIVAAELTKLGWAMDPASARRRFLGMTFTDMEPVIARTLGREIDPLWRAGLAETIIAAMASEVGLIDGAVAALDGADALGLRWRIASNSSHQELAVKFARVGLTRRVAGRVHSHADVARGKPAPDLFEACAVAEGVAAGHCIVIEDSEPGTRAAQAAGMFCLGYAPHGDGAELAANGALVFHSMHDIPRLLALATRVNA
jgi:beta-phosphoglucomutase-like phosphatase (HAD superfamily)